MFVLQEVVQKHCMRVTVKQNINGLENLKWIKTGKFSVKI